MRLLDHRRTRRDQLVAQLKHAVEVWSAAKTDMERAVEAVGDLESVVGSVRNIVVGFVERRGGERRRLEERLGR
ncbi:hypothetical protein BC829DRAFT_387903, partial [Chytridium lagenaria]